MGNKFWFDLEKGFIMETGIGDKSIPLSSIDINKRFDNDALLFLKKKRGIKTGKIKPVTNYSSLRTGDKVIGYFNSSKVKEKLALATIWRRDEYIYAIQDVAIGANPGEDCDDDSWMDLGKHGWFLCSSLSRINDDHRDLHHYIPSSDELSYDDESREYWDNNLPIDKIGSLISWKGMTSKLEEIRDSDYCIVLFLDDLLVELESLEDIKKGRKENRQGATKLLSDDEIRKMNLDRYLQSLGKFKDEEGNLTNLQKFITYAIIGKFGFYSLYNYMGVDYISRFISILENSIKVTSERDKELYKERLNNLFKSIYRLYNGYKDNYFYPSAGLSFIPTKAFDGLKSDKGLNYAKLSASIVRVGNTSIVSPYDINSIYSVTGGFPIGSLSSFSPNQNPTDPLIKPEFMTTAEFGINLGFLNDRITLDASYYSTKTTDLITRQSTSAGSGISSVLTNIGQMTTTGYEIDLGFTPVKASDFNNLGLKWENRLAYSHTKSIVDKVSESANEVALQNFTGAGVGIFATEGEEFPLIKGIAYERDDQGRVLIDPVSGNPIRTTDYKILGKATPDYVINYNTAVEFKGIRLAAVMDYRTGHQFWSGTKDWLSWSGHLYESAENGRTGFIFPNSAVETSPGVYTENTSVVTGGTTYTSYLNYFSNEYRAVVENFVLDATAFKVRELSLSYLLPESMIEKTGLTSLRLGVNARNPFIVLPKENRNYNDPEQSRSSGNDQGLAVSGQYPATRTFGFSLNASF
ncbi:MAG: TonB-dependent receptor [Romboutsia sp.]|nr:MAG: TonB-dependent receptor [Romboutsia sp.]